EVVVGIVRERLMAPDCKKGFILDGFPRTLPQAEALDATLGEMKRAIDHVIFNPPAKEGICNVCGGELYQRDDDQEETIRARLQVYDEQTAPLIAYYREKGLLRTIDGVGKIEEIFQAIVKALEK
ncbi:MAG: nucleoside monophosphate kinase, partial [Deltaproteobacteria bacterium]